MAMADPATVATAWERGMANASTKYKESISRVTESPTQKAAQNVNAYLQGIQDSVQKWQAGLNRVSLQEWKDKAINVGASRLASGAAAAKPKMQAFLAQFLPILANNVAQVKAMPNATYEDRKARMNAMADLNHQFRRS